MALSRTTVVSRIGLGLCVLFFTTLSLAGACQHIPLTLSAITYHPISYCDEILTEILTACLILLPLS